MGYNKIIVAGNSFEIYEYDKNISPFAGIRKQRPKGEVGERLLASRGEDVLSSERLGKRHDNANRSRLAFARFVRSNLVGTDRPALFTLTYKENMCDLKQGYRDFTSFVQALRYRFGQGFRYICVPEFQKRGAVHFHALFWGLPEELVFRQERKTRFFAKLWGLGFVYIKPTDGNERLSYYLAKYMTKAYLDPRLRNCKAYVGSRNCFRPSVMSDVSPVWPILEDYGVMKLDPLREKLYMTQWLGRGRYRLYKLD